MIISPGVTALWRSQSGTMVLTIVSRIGRAGQPARERTKYIGTYATATENRFLTAAQELIRWRRDELLEAAMSPPAQTRRALAQAWREIKP